MTLSEMRPEEGRACIVLSLEDRQDRRVSIRAWVGFRPGETLGLSSIGLCATGLCCDRRLFCVGEGVR